MICKEICKRNSLPVGRLEGRCNSAIPAARIFRRKSGGELRRPAAGVRCITAGCRQTCRLEMHPPFASSQAPYRSQRPKCRRSLISLLVLFPREPLCWVRAGTLLTLSKRMRRARWKEKSRRGLWDTYGPNAPQKRELDSPRVWRVLAVPTARRASGACCRPHQPTCPPRLKGFYQLLAAAD